MAGLHRYNLGANAASDRLITTLECYEHRIDHDEKGGRMHIIPEQASSKTTEKRYHEKHPRTQNFNKTKKITSSLMLVHQRISICFLQ